MSSCGPNDTSSCCRFSRAARWQDLSTANAAKDAAAKQAAVQAAKQAADEAEAAKAASAVAALVAKRAANVTWAVQKCAIEIRHLAHRTPCTWCASITCSHCQCPGYSCYSHAQGEPCSSERYRRSLVCNACQKRKQLHRQQLIKQQQQFVLPHLRKKQRR